jgi:tight adherence protein B
MRRHLAAVASALLVVLAVPLSAFAADGDADPLNIDALDIADYPEVRFSVDVPAHPAGPRPADAFTLTEDGQQRAIEVQEASSTDLQVVLMIDTTGSMGGAPLEGAKAAATAFLSQVPEDTGIAVVNYDTEATVLSDFSAGRAEHLAAVDGLVAGGFTAMYDAVSTAVAAFGATDGKTRRVVVLLTDGEDNASESTVDDAITALEGEDVTLHSIEYLTDSGDEAAIRRMADATGGSVREAADAAALTQVYEELAASLVSRYDVVYTSEINGPAELVIEVDHAGLVAVGSRRVSLPAASAATEETVAAPLAPEPPTTITGDATFFGRFGLIIGGTLWFGASAIVLLVLFAPRRRVTQLSSAERVGAGKRGLSEFAKRASSAADRGLERRGRRTGLNTALERAGINLRPGEFLVLSASIAVTALVVGVLTAGWLAGALLAVITVIVARLAVSFLADRRQKRFADQLGETLQLLSGSLRAGYSLMQAVDAVAREADAPACEEFGRLVVETRLGRDMTDALLAMSDRMQCEDFTWVMQAIEIHREVGGDLAEVLDTVAGTIRERNQVRRQVQALSAEGRLSGYVLLALPFGIGFMIFLTNPAYLGELTSGGLLGWGLIALAGLLMLVGVVWMRKLVKLVF